MDALPSMDWITPDLAIGGACSGAHAPGLRAAGVTGLIDVRGEAAPDRPALARLGIRALHLPTPDRFGPSLASLDAGVVFARRVEHARGRLLVHCTHGIGRSTTVALAILVDRGMGPMEALRLAKRRRARISLSASQYEAWAAWLRLQPGPLEVPRFDEITPVIWAGVDM